MVDEANAIGTAYLRLDLLPVQIQPVLREQFRRYAQARVRVFQVLPDVEASHAQALVALDYQRYGFIRLDFADQAMLDLLGRMK